MDAGRSARTVGARAPHARALAHGAAGFISKRSGLDELQTALRAVLAAQTWLPPSLRGVVLAATDDAEERRLAEEEAARTSRVFFQTETRAGSPAATPGGATMPGLPGIDLAGLTGQLGQQTAQ